MMVMADKSRKRCNIGVWGMWRYCCVWIRTMTYETKIICGTGFWGHTDEVYVAAKVEVEAWRLMV